MVVSVITPKANGFEREGGRAHAAAHAAAGAACVGMVGLSRRREREGEKRERGLWFFSPPPTSVVAFGVLVSGLILFVVARTASLSLPLAALFVRADSSRDGMSYASVGPTPDVGDEDRT